MKAPLPLRFAVGASLVVSIATGCTRAAPLTMLIDAQRQAADLHLQFSQTVEQSSQAVLAESDTDSEAGARAAEASAAAVTKNIARLRTLLDNLGYAPESMLLASFSQRFGEYRQLESEILQLAVQNTNTKAQKLAFGEGREAADAFVASLNAMTSRKASPPHIELQIARAEAAVREIQAIQPRHIAEADEAAMTKMEGEMNAAEARARMALTAVTHNPPPGADKELATAAASLDRFIAINRDVIALSRRNSDVRSTALSLGKKRLLAAQCDDLLRQLEESLATHDFKATR